MLFASQITEVAHNAATKYYNEQLGGADTGACGFASVTVYTKYKGNTREGRNERRDLEQLGFRKTYTGGYELHNPSQLAVQSVGVKYEGARAAAKLMKEHGYKAYATQRLD